MKFFFILLGVSLVANCYLVEAVLKAAPEATPEAEAIADAEASLYGRILTRGYGNTFDGPPQNNMAMIINAGHNIHTTPIRSYHVGTIVNGSRRPSRSPVLYRHEVINNDQSYQNRNTNLGYNSPTTSIVSKSIPPNTHDYFHSRQEGNDRFHKTEHAHSFMEHSNSARHSNLAGVGQAELDGRYSSADLAEILNSWTGARIINNFDTNDNEFKKGIHPQVKSDPLRIVSGIGGLITSSRSVMVTEKPLQNKFNTRNVNSVINKHNGHHDFVSIGSGSIVTDHDSERYSSVHHNPSINHHDNTRYGSTGHNHVVINHDNKEFDSIDPNSIIINNHNAGYNSMDSNLIVVDHNDGNLEENHANTHLLQSLGFEIADATEYSGSGEFISGDDVDHGGLITVMQREPVNQEYSHSRGFVEQSNRDLFDIRHNIPGEYSYRDSGGSHKFIMTIDGRNKVVHLGHDGSVIESGNSINEARPDSAPRYTVLPILTHKRHIGQPLENYKGELTYGVGARSRGSISEQYSGFRADNPRQSGSVTDTREIVSRHSGHLDKGTFSSRESFISHNGQRNERTPSSREIFSEQSGEKIRQSFDNEEPLGSHWEWINTENVINTGNIRPFSNEYQRPIHTSYGTSSNRGYSSNGGTVNRHRGYF